MQRVYQMHQSDILVQHRLLRLTQLTKMGIHDLLLLLLIYYYIISVDLSHNFTLLCTRAYAGFHSIYLEATTDFESMAFPGLRGMSCWHHSQLDGRAMVCIRWLLIDLRLRLSNYSIIYVYFSCNVAFDIGNGS